MDIIKALAEELNIGRHQAEAAVKLIDEGNTIPFIARYRKEATGSLNDEVLRNLDERLKYLRNLEDRKEQVISAISDQGKMTAELEKQIRRLLSDAGIFSEKISGVEAEITAEKKLLVKINLKAAITESQKEAVKNGLERICGLEETQYQILDSGNGVEGVGNPVASGNSSSGGRTSGIPENK